jgi:hypothetical protein
MGVSMKNWKGSEKATTTAVIPAASRLYQEGALRSGEEWEGL